MEELVGSFSTLVARGRPILLVFARAYLLLNDDSATLRSALLRVEVRDKEEFSEDLSNEILLLDDAIAQGIVGRPNDLACQSDQADEESLLFCC